MVIRQDLKEFQQDLVAQLTQDVGRLQAEKVQLLSDIAQLRQQKQTLQSQSDDVLSRQQMMQQQIWAKQLAQALATRLYVLLAEKIQHDPSGLATTPGRYVSAASSAVTSTGSAERSLTSLGSAVNQTLTSLRQDLDSYQSTLSQQVNRMQTLERQGEVILEALVSRMNQQLQALSSVPPSSLPYGSVSARYPSEGPPAEYASVPSRGEQPLGSYRLFPDGVPLETRSTPPEQRSSASPQSLAGMPQVPPTPQPQNPPSRFQGFSPPAGLKDWLSGISSFQKGLILILLSTMALSLHNVVVGVIGNESSIFNIWRTGGFISLNSLGSSLLILWLRMIIVMPLMALITTVLHPPTWSDIKSFAISNDRKLLRNVIGSGFFLFLSQVLIYIAIGQVGPGVAVTILFMYPIITVPLAWLLFGDRPTSLRLLVMLCICTGVIFTAFPNLASNQAVSWLGVGTAVLAGIAFACYLISMQLSFRRLHPVPVSVIQFFTIFSLTSIFLLMRPASVIPSNPFGLIVGAILLGTLTLAGYLLNNFGVRFMGAARASIVASSGPALTALLAFLITPGEKNQLQWIQVLGILIVTVGVTALALERMLVQRRMAQKQTR